LKFINNFTIKKTKGFKMATTNSKLLKEAIADAKAVRETAIANAKIALEEAFTPRLQSILSKKLQAEMEDMDDEEEEVVEDLGSSEIGTEDNEEPAAVADDASTDLGAESEEEDAEVGEEDENLDVVSEEEYDSEEEMTEEDEIEISDEEEIEDEDEDELDLESIIRELESELDEEDENQDGVQDDPTGATMEEEDEMDFDSDEEDEMEMNFDSEEESDEDDVIDLDEILREMGYGDDEEEVTEEEEGEDEMQVAQTELKNAYSTIQELRKTINEVNLLNAKLLYANKLFRGYNLTNEQKVKVVENLDRTTSVREVKLVYATLAESMKFTGTERKVVSTKKTMTEGLASKISASTAPKKEIIAESNELANRFKELAGIIKK
jgi:hypothetical protein